MGRADILKQVKLNRLTIHDPGHSSRGSGAPVVVVTGGGVGLRVGLGFGVVNARVLSQQTVPRLQLAVFDISTDGLSQNAAIILSKQNPGHLGAEIYYKKKTIVEYQIF